MFQEFCLPIGLARQPQKPCQQQRVWWVKEQHNADLTKWTERRFFCAWAVPVQQVTLLEGDTQFSGHCYNHKMK
jgi:hypothetical protein